MDKGMTGIHGNGTAVATSDKPAIPVPESVREALDGKLQFAKQTQEMFNSARTQYQAFVDGVAAAAGVPAGYRIDVEAWEFVPVEEEPSDPNETEG